MAGRCPSGFRRVRGVGCAFGGALGHAPAPLRAPRRRLVRGHRDPPYGDAQIDVLQLRRWWRARADILATPVGAWFWFFNEAQDWTEVPAEIDSPTMEQAMEILHDVRKDTFLNDLYRGREEAERVERGARKALEKAQRGEEQERRLKEEALQREAAALSAKEAAVAEAERLRALLVAAGIRLPDPG